MSLTSVQRLCLFLSLSFVGSGSLALTFYLSGGEPQSAAARALALLYTVIPCVVALLVQGALSKRPILGPFGFSIPNRWLFVGWFGAAVILLLNLILASFFKDAEVVITTSKFIQKMNPPIEVAEQLVRQFFPPVVELALQGLIAGGTLSAMMVFWEEVGFRGYLFQEIGQLPFFKNAFLKKALLMGTVWGLWSMPLSIFGFFPSDFMFGAVLLFLWCLVMSPLLNYLRLRTHSLFGPVILRGSLLALMQIPSTVIFGFDMHRMSLYGMTGIASVVIFFFLVVRVEAFARRTSIAAIFDETLSKSSGEQSS